VLATAALTFSWRIFEAVRTLHHGLMLVFLAGMVGFCLSGDLFNMFVFYELFSVAAYALAGYQTTNPGSVRGSPQLRRHQLGRGDPGPERDRPALRPHRRLNLAQLGQALARGPADRLVVVAFLLLMVGFFVKAAVVPFHFWLADAYALARPWSGCCSPGWCPSSACTPSPASTGRCSRPPWPGSRGCAGCCCSGPWPPPWSAG
jgi:multicomponent Na+:H+ antiporter subunit D